MMKRLPTTYRQRGLTLVELMIAMAIGLVLIGGTLFVYSSSRAAYNTNEIYSLMQENARFALSVMEPDVELAGYWGQHRDATVIIGSARDIQNTGSGALSIAVGGECGTDWVVQFDRHIEGHNDIDTSWAEWDCVSGADVQTGSDVFAVRHVEAEVAAALNDGQIYLRSSEAPLSEVFQGTVEPPSFPLSASNYSVVANAYYVSPTSAGFGYSDGSGNGADALPSLRRIQLTTQSGNPIMIDTEITTGVEDMQIQYGIGPPDIAGTRGGVNVYVNDITNLTPPNTVVRSMRIWLLMRGERSETSHRDDKEYRLGDKVVPPFNDNYRRMVVSKTIFLRNLH